MNGEGTAGPGGQDAGGSDPAGDPEELDLAAVADPDPVPGLWVVLAVFVWGIAFVSPILIGFVVLALGGDALAAQAASMPMIGVLLASGSVWAARRCGRTPADIGWRRSRHLWRDLALAAAVALVVVVVAEGWDRILTLMGVTADFLEPYRALLASPFLTVMLVIGAVLTAPIGEEVFFRGFLLSMMSQRAARWTSILVVSFLFTISHFGSAAAWPPLFVFAVLLGWLRLRTGSLVAPIAAHVLNNLVSVTLLVLRLV